MGTSLSTRVAVPFIGGSVGELASLSFCRFHSPFLSRGIGLEILAPRTDFCVDVGDGFRGSTSFPLVPDCCTVCSCKSCRGSNANPTKYAVGIIYGVKGRSGYCRHSNTREWKRIREKKKNDVLPPRQATDACIGQALRPVQSLWPIRRSSQARPNREIVISIPAPSMTIARFNRISCHSIPMFNPHGKRGGSNNGKIRSIGERQQWGSSRCKMQLK